MTSWGGLGVAIVGAAECDLGSTGLPVVALQAQAVMRAVRDAGLKLGDVDGLATAGVSRFSTTQMAEYLGLQLSWSESSYLGGSSYEAYVGRAVEAIRAGVCRTVVISFASNQRSARSRSLVGPPEAATPELQFEAPYRPLFPVSYYAMVAQRYLEHYRVERAALAEVAVAARAWALRNPKAFRFGSAPLTVDEVLSSEQVSSPLGVLDCCLVTDGGGAVVLTSLERSRDLVKPPIMVLGYGEATTNVSMTGATDLLATGSAQSGSVAYAMAGLTPEDVDVFEVYDSFTITVLLTLEGLGLSAPGEAAQLIAERGIGPGGRLALNTSGGGLSYCHPGQFGVLLLVEAVRQLRGEADGRQVADAEVALVHGTGGIFSHHATVLLGADR